VDSKDTRPGAVLASHGMRSRDAFALASSTAHILVLNWSIMNRPLAIVTSVAMLALALVVVIQRPASLHAQEPRATFRGGVALVPITASVRDSRNRIVRWLARGDFEVLENGRARPIVDFRAMENAPLSIALLFDTSGSMRGPALNTGKAVVGELLESIEPAADEIALFTFDKAIRQETPFAGTPDTIWRALDDIDAWGLTSFYDAIAATAKQLADRPSLRRAVIVVTDGADTSSTLSSPEVSGMASAIDVPVYIIAVVPPRLAQSGVEGQARDERLSNLAYWTGGELMYVPAPAGADRAVDALIAELRHQYFMAIESAAAAGWRRLEVRTTRRGLTVRARSGYFATAS
jgi:Ca-activated chloride channel family protein